MHKYVIGILLLCMFCSCSSRHGVYYENNFQEPIGTGSLTQNGSRDGAWSGEDWKGGYVNGRRHGQWEEWYGNGDLKAEYTYNKGRLNGDVVVWRTNGKIDKFEQYLDGKLDGLKLTTPERGRNKIANVDRYKAGKKNGISVSFWIMSKDGFASSRFYKDGESVVCWLVDEETGQPTSYSNLDEYNTEIVDFKEGIVEFIQLQTKDKKTKELIQWIKYRHEKGSDNYSVTKYAGDTEYLSTYDCNSSTIIYTISKKTQGVPGSRVETFWMPKERWTYTEDKLVKHERYHYDTSVLKNVYYTKPNPMPLDRSVFAKAPMSNPPNGNPHVNYIYKYDDPKATHGYYVNLVENLEKKHD